MYERRLCRCVNPQRQVHYKYKWFYHLAACFKNGRWPFPSVQAEYYIGGGGSWGLFRVCYALLRLSGLRHSGRAFARRRESRPDAGGGSDRWSEFLPGFALQRANSRMLRNADRRRRNARACGKYSSRGTRSLTSSDDDY